MHSEHEHNPIKNRRRLRLTLISGVGVLASAYAATMGCMYANQERMLFPGAYHAPPKSAGPAKPRVQQIWITTDDGYRVEAWYQPGRGRFAANPGPAYMYFHGNADTVDTAWWIADHTVPAGFSTLVVEYRGYGRSDGEPSEAALVVDSVRFRDWLADRPEVDPDRFVLHGMSLGGAVAVGVAEQRRPAALILESTFTSVAALAHRYLMPASLCRHPFHSDRILPGLGVPVAIFHGKWDATIPISHGRRLHELTPNSEFTELDCGHHNFHNDWRNIAAFLRRHGLIHDEQ